MSTKSSIQVCIKLRPCEKDQTSLWQVKDGKTINLIDSQTDPYVFDYVCDQDTDNQNVFECMAKHIVHSCLQGFNGTIFAYGQTSSGKTYTMMGDDSNPGVMVLAAKEIFKEIGINTDREFLLRVNYMEIYNEKINDLLNKTNQDLKIHEAGTGVVNVNCEEYIITCEEDLLHFLNMGNKERTVGETNMNERSSRSHAIFRIIIESRKSDRSECDAVKQSVLNLVDLAGSERADQTGARGTRLKEGGHINKSLLFLSNVIKSLSENKDFKYISFRDSKLTRILQTSLGGNAYTSIICTIKPSIMDESQSTLNFALRAKKIRIKPQVNEIVSDATMMKRLESEIKDLKCRLAEEVRKNESKTKVNQLQEQLKRDMLKIISSNSLNDKQQYCRRRTWCPATTSIMDGHKTRLQLPKPRMFDISQTQKHTDVAPKTIAIFNYQDADKVDKTELNTANLCRFDITPEDFKTPKAQISSYQELQLTPNFKEMGNKRVEILEREIMELQTYTNLEKQIDVKHDQVAALIEKLTILTARKDELEAERIEYLQLKHDLSINNKIHSDLEMRCDTLMSEVEELTASKREVASKAEQLDQHIDQLKQKIADLEIENREAVELGFEYKSLKLKSKFREEELLSALADKDTLIENLKKTLGELERETFLRNTKDAHMYSICPDVSQNCENSCTKSTNLDCLQGESSKHKSDFDNMAKELEKLQVDLGRAISESNDAKYNENMLKAQINIKENECVRLREENIKLKQLEETIKQMSNDMAEKTKHCEALSNNILEAHNKFSLLQEKYNNAELTSHQQCADYNVIQQKYQSVQHENSSLENNIEELKSKYSEAIENGNSERQKLKLRISELTEKLSVLQNEFNELQRVYDDLSIQLVDSVQENDVLRLECEKLRKLENFVNAQVSTNGNSLASSGFGNEENESDGKDCIIHYKVFESLHQIELQSSMGISRLFKAMDINRDSESSYKLCLKSSQEVLVRSQVEEDETVPFIGLLKQHKLDLVELEKNFDNDSSLKMLKDHIDQLERDIIEKNAILHSTECTLNEMREQMTNLESALLEKSVIVNKVEDYQRQIESLKSQHAEMTIVCEELQEKVKDSIEGSVLDNSNETLAHGQDTHLAYEMEVFRLEQDISSLKDEVDRLQEQLRLRDLNIENLNSNIHELNEKLIANENIRSELLLQLKQKEQLLQKEEEKSVLNGVSTSPLHKSNGPLIGDSDKAETDLKQSFPDFVLKIQDYESKIIDSKTALEKANMELEEEKILYTNELRKLQLEYYEKLDLSENEFRKRFHDCKREWDEEKETYENKLAGLSEELNLAKEYKNDILLEKIRNDYEYKLQEYEQKILSYNYEQVNSEKSIQKLKAENESLESRVESLSKRLDHQRSEFALQVNNLEKLEKLREKLDESLNQTNMKLLAAQEKEETFNSKVTNLLAELEETKLKASNVDKLSLDNENLKHSLSKASEENNHLAEKVKIAEAQLSEAKSNAKAGNADQIRLQLELKSALNEKDQAHMNYINLLEKFTKQEEKLLQETNEYEQKIKDLENSLCELQLKLQSLQKENLELQSNTQTLTEKLNDVKNAESLLEEHKLKSDTLRNSNSDLLKQLEAATAKITENVTLRSELTKQNAILLSAVEEAGNKCKELSNRLTSEQTLSNQLTTELVNLRLLLKTKEESFQAATKRLDETISCLMGEKLNLQEKLLTLEDITKKLDIEMSLLQKCKSNNSSLSQESNPTNLSPVARNSIERDSSLPKKSSSFESDARKIRRMSIFDENRLQSFLNDNRSVGTMTDSVDFTEINNKLEDCQRDLFISKSQVTALTIELKNHPLKEENTKLKQRLQEEQEKGRVEIKRFKQKNHDLNIKINALTTKLTSTENIHSARSVNTCYKMVSHETQTESDLEVSLKQLKDKNEHLTALCRSRYKMIEDLEEQLKQNPNAYEKRQLKNECERQTLELETLTEKYHVLKKALKMLSMEREELRQAANGAPPT